MNPADWLRIYEQLQGLVLNAPKDDAAEVRRRMMLLDRHIAIRPGAEERA